jgi:phage-related protein
MTLGIEIVEDTIEDLEVAIDAVKALFSDGELYPLEQTLESGDVRSADAELSGDLNPSRISPVSVRMVLDFTMPDPFFYSDTLTTNTTTINASPKTYTINNPGTAEKCNPKFVLTGPLSNTEITNTANDVSVKYNGMISAGHYVTIDQNPVTDEFRAVTDLDVNVIGSLSHLGDAAYMVLKSGDNPMSVTDDTHSTGTVKIEFYPPNT